jgi:prephenate dehydratase
MDSPQSPETQKVMEEAIAAHFAAIREGATMTGYFLTVKGKTIEDLDNQITRYAVIAPDHMEYDQVLGLARFGFKDVDNDSDEAD